MKITQTTLTFDTAAQVSAAQAKLDLVDVANPEVPEGRFGGHVGLHLQPNRTVAQDAPVGPYTVVILG